VCSSVAPRGPDDPGPLVGKLPPALELSHAVQGVPWSLEDFAGQVVVVDFFQLGCAGCWQIELPAAQQLMDLHKDDDRFRVVGVATAFEKVEHPEMADESLMRRELAAKKYTMAVMRDRDERSIRLVGTKEGVGTPMTLVVGPDGVVRWHNFDDSPQSAKAVREVVKKLLQEYDVPPIEPLPPQLESYRKRDFASASIFATQIRQNSTSPKELRAAADQVVENLAGAIAARLKWVDQKRARGLPADAQRMLDTALRIFDKVPAAKALVDRRNEWKNDPKFAKELAAAAEVETILAEVADPDAEKAKLVAALQKVEKSCPKTPVAERIERELARLR
jgi:thiol-disulfide isomerase/thioredoxin